MAARHSAPAGSIGAFSSRHDRTGRWSTITAAGTTTTRPAPARTRVHSSTKATSRSGPGGRPPAARTSVRSNTTQAAPTAATSRSTPVGSASARRRRSPSAPARPRHPRRSQGRPHGLAHRVVSHRLRNGQGARAPVPPWRPRRSSRPQAAPNQVGSSGSVVSRSTATRSSELDAIARRSSTAASAPGASGIPTTRNDPTDCGASEIGPPPTTRRVMVRSSTGGASSSATRAFTTAARRRALRGRDAARSATACITARPRRLRAAIGTRAAAARRSTPSRARTSGRCFRLA